MTKYEREVINRIAKYTNIPRLYWDFETKEYQFVISVLEEINIIFTNLELLGLCQENLRKYDDKETIDNIYNAMEQDKQNIENSFKRLEELTEQHKQYLGNMQKEV